MADHISASQISLFLNEPAAWIVTYLYGVKGSVGAGAWRGSACEAAMDAILFEDASDADAANVAQTRFEQDAQGDLANDVAKERAAIPLYLTNLLPVARKLLAEKGKPLVRQARIELNLPEIRPILLGYLDWMWGDQIIDLKTVSRSPSFAENGRIKDKPEHLRQMAIYSRAKGKPCTLLYATPTKQRPAIPYAVSDEECEIAMRQVLAGARAMTGLLDAAARGTLDPVGYPPRDLNDYYWSDETRAVARQIWSL